MVTTESVPEDQPWRVASRKMSKRWWIVLLIIFLAGGVIFFTAGRTRQTQAVRQQTDAAAHPVPVGIAAARKGDMNVYIYGLGSVTPLCTVTVRSRVDGQLMEVLFKEGQTVKAGQLIATIDPRPFEVQLAQAGGQLARDGALLQNA
jgi:membrane fusion protein, multidrug efflux system